MPIALLWVVLCLMLVLAFLMLVFPVKTFRRSIDQGQGSTWSFFHSYARPRKYILYGVLFGILYFLGRLWLEDGGSYWAFIISLAGIFGVFFINRQRSQHLKSVWPRAQRYAEHAGWQLQPTLDFQTIRPKHLAPTPRSKQPVHSDGKVMSKLDPTFQTMYFVYEEYFTRSTLLGHKTFLAALCYIVVVLPGRLPGWARLLPEENLFLKFLPDTDTEYRAFNKKYYVHAEPKKLGTHVLTPDFIDWYFGLPIQPWLHVEENSVCLSLGWDPKYEEIQELTAIAPQVRRFIERSGALEKTAPPPRP